MSTGRTTTPAELDSAAAMLAELLFPFDGGATAIDAEVVQPHDIPHPADSLLVHHNHMTVELKRHFGHSVQLHVMREVIAGDVYSRLIRLTSDNLMVECGIARLNLALLSPHVRNEILEKQTPLGAILIDHNVHRRIKPRYFLRLPPQSRVMQALGASNDVPVYGRLGTIYCDHEPAIELLEVVLSTDAAVHRR